MPLFGLFSISASAQTNVFDNVIATSPNHSSLEAALIAAGLDDDLQNPAGTFTVFAPDNTAFSALATQLGVTVNDLLALPKLADILTYHVLGSEVPASAVTTADVEADNGVVHVIDKVFLQTFLGIDEVSATVIGTYLNPASDVISIVGLNEGKYTIFNN